MTCRQSGEQNERPPRAAPIEYFDFDVTFDWDHLNGVRRGISLQRIQKTDTYQEQSQR
jgi:hypothetical protein